MEISIDLSNFSSSFPISMFLFNLTENFPTSVVHFSTNFPISCRTFQLKALQLLVFITALSNNTCKVDHSNVCKVVTRSVTIMCINLSPIGTLQCATPIVYEFQETKRVHFMIKRSALQSKVLTQNVKSNWHILNFLFWYWHRPPWRVMSWHYQF